MRPAGPAPALRMGLVTYGGRLEGWQVRCLEALQAGGDAELRAWVHWPHPTPAARSLAGRLARAVRGRRSHAALQALPAAGRFHAAPGADLDPASRQRLRALELDVLLALDPPPEPARLAGLSRRGLWWFQHPSEPRGFWEAYRGQPLACASLVQGMAGDGDGLAEVELRAGVLRTVPGSYRHTRRQLLGECARWPAEACRAARAGLRHGPSGARWGTEVGSVAPAWWQWPASFLSGAMRRLAHAWQRATRVDLWNVGVVRAPIERFLREPVGVVEWMPGADGRRLRADPFGLVRAAPGARTGVRSVVYEALDFAEGRGFLAARDLTEAGFGPEREVLRLPWHLSYPCLVARGPEVFCIPESHEAGEIALYRAAPFPGRWDKAAVLRAGYRGIDSTLVEHEGRWWCFTTNRDDGHATRLDLFWAEDLLGPWNPHPLNPVLIDVRGARGAGTPFRHEGRLYRPAQDYSRKLEHRITLRRVLELTTESYREEPVTTLEPLAGTPFPHKLHTLSALGDWTLVDGAREVHVLSHPRFLRFKLRRLLARQRPARGS